MWMREQRRRASSRKQLPQDAWQYRLALLYRIRWIRRFQYKAKLASGGYVAVYSTRKAGSRNPSALGECTASRTLARVPT
jgi:hypothetical protein